MVFYLLTIILSFSQPIPATGQASAEDLFQVGEEQRQSGDWKAALNTWFEAKTAGRAPDPRIGISFIELVAEQEAEQYYQLADEMYFWGLETSNLNKFSQIFEAEIARLVPLMDRVNADELRQLFRERDPAFIAKIKEFWIKSDPYPASTYNRRLIEHWRRIAVARQRYTHTTNSPYGTDDRGEIYVRLGEPPSIKTRSVSINQVTDPVSGAAIDLLNNVSFRFEIWYYTGPSGQEPTSYVFGEPGSGGPFGLQPGILSLVPVAGNRISGYVDQQQAMLEESNARFTDRSNNLFNNSEGLLLSVPGHTEVSRDGAELMLKYAALEEIGAIDRFYNEMYQTMTQEVVRASLSGSGEKFTESARSNLHKYNADELSTALIRDQQMPRARSDSKGSLHAMPYRKQIYRFLDDSFQPLYMLVTETTDYSAVAVHMNSKPTSTPNDIFQVNTLYQYDDRWQLTKTQPHLIPVNSEGYFGKGIYYFEEPGEQQILFGTQFLCTQSHEQSTAPLHKQLNAEILASSEMEPLNFPERLTIDQELEFQVSDVILAHMQPEDTEARIPFAPNLDGTFQNSDDIVVYFEVYNLLKGTSYRTSYYFEEIRRNRSRKVEEKGTVILNYISDSLLNKNWFEAELSGLQKGENYALVIEVNRDESSQSIIRRIPFRIVE